MSQKEGESIISLAFKRAPGGPQASRGMPKVYWKPREVIWANNTQAYPSMLTQPSLPPYYFTYPPPYLLFLPTSLLHFIMKLFLTPPFVTNFIRIVFLLGRGWGEKRVLNYYYDNFVSFTSADSALAAILLIDNLNYDITLFTHNTLHEKTLLLN